MDFGNTDGFIDGINYDLSRLFLSLEFEISKRFSILDGFEISVVNENREN